MMQYSLSLQHKVAIQLASLFLASLFVLYAGIILFISTSDPDLLKNRIIIAIEAELNGQAEINHADWSLFPGVVLELHGLRLSTNAGEELLSTTTVQITLSPFALLQEELQITSLALEGTTTTFDFSDHSKTPWKGLLTQKSATSKSRLENLSLDSLVMNNSDITLTTKNGTIQLNQALIQILDFKFDHHSELAIQGSLIVQNEDIAAQSNSIDIQSFLKVNEKTIQLRQILGQTIWQGLHADTLNIDIKGEADYLFSEDSFKFDPMSININDAQVAILTEIQNLTTNPFVIMHLPAQKPNLSRLLKPYIGDTLGMDHIIDLMDSLRLGGNIVLSDGDVGLLLDTFEFDSHPGSINLSYRYDTQLWESDIKLAYIDLRPILAPAKSATIRGRQVRRLHKFGIRSVGLPIDHFQELSLDLSLNIGHLILPNILMQNFSLQADFDQGIANISPITFNAFNGKMTARAELDTNQTPAKLDMMISGDRLDIADLLSSTTSNSWMTGHFNSILTLSTEGNTVEALLDSAIGTLDINFKKGAIPGANFHGIAHQNLLNIKNNYGNTAYIPVRKNKTVGLEGTQIDDLFTTLQITPNAIRTKKILARLNNESTTGKLHYSRSSQKLAFTLNVQLPNRESMVTWPVTCIIEDWKLPECGVTDAALIDQIALLMRPNRYLEDRTHLDSHIIDESLRQVFQQLR